MQNHVWKIRSLMQFFRNMSAVLILLTLGAPAWSQPNDDRASEMLSRADLNGDGQVTRKELEKSRSKTLERLDRTKDTVINTKDRPPRPFSKRFDEAFARMVDEFDANDDGQVTRKEFVEGPTTGFDAADLDGNDILSAEEIAKLNPPGG